MRFKKSMIYTIFASLLIGVIIASTLLISNTSFQQSTVVSSSRILGMNDFILSMHQDAERNLYICGYRSLLSLQKYVADKGMFIDNFENKFKEVIVNGTINGENQDLMENATIIKWVERINEEINTLNIRFNITVNSISVIQQDPRNIIIQLNATINITDSNDLASWHYNKTFIKEMELTGFEDPFYTIGSENKVTNIILFANNTNFVNRTNNDTNILKIHLNNSYYIESNNSPSFLMRFIGNYSSSIYGIESMVNIVDFSSQGIPAYNKSLIDYQYFNNNYSGSDKCGFQNMTSWFRIDNTKLEKYNLTGMGVSC